MIFMSSQNEFTVTNVQLAADSNLTSKNKVDKVGKVSIRSAVVCFPPRQDSASRRCPDRPGHLNSQHPFRLISMSDDVGVYSLDSDITNTSTR